MNSADDQRWRVLDEALADLARRQADIERRLDRLESTAPARPDSPAAPVPMPVPARQTPPRARGELETRMGLTWINRIGVITFVLGVAFFFKYAVDNRWIGEAGRVALGVAAGLAALGFGDWLWRGGQRTFAQGISGAGVAILYVSFYASAGFYRVLSLGAAFASMTAVTLGAGLLSARYRSPAIAALGLTGGYLTPVVLKTGAAFPWFFLSYVLLLDAGALALARLREWRRLHLLAFTATIVLLASITTFPAAPGRRAVLATFSMLYAALFTALPGRVIPALAQVAGMTWAWGVWADGAAPPWQRAGLAALAVLLAGAQLAWLRNRPQTDRAAGVLASFLIFAAPAMFSGYQMTLAWCALALVLAWPARRTGMPRLADAAGVALLFIVVRLYGADLYAARRPRFAVFVAAAMVFWAAAWLFGRDGRALAAYVAGHVHMLWILGIEVLDWSRRGTLPENLASVESASLSVLMGAYALVLVAAGVAGRSTLNRILGLSLTGIVILKLYLYDVWQLSRIYRFSAFALLGALLLVTSYLYSRFRARQEP